MAFWSCLTPFERGLIYLGGEALAFGDHMSLRLSRAAADTVIGILDPVFLATCTTSCPVYIERPSLTCSSRSSVLQAPTSSFSSDLLTSPLLSSMSVLLLTPPPTAVLRSFPPSIMPALRSTPSSMPTIGLLRTPPSSARRPSPPPSTSTSTPSSIQTYSILSRTSRLLRTPRTSQTSASPSSSATSSPPQDRTSPLPSSPTSSSASSASSSPASSTTSSPISSPTSTLRHTAFSTGTPEQLQKARDQAFSQSAQKARKNRMKREKRKAKKAQGTVDC